MLKKFTQNKRELFQTIYRKLITKKIAISRGLSISEAAFATSWFNLGLHRVLKALGRAARFLLNCVGMLFLLAGGLFKRVNAHKKIQLPHFVEKGLSWFSTWAYKVRFGHRGRLIPCSLMAAITIMIFSAGYLGIGVEVLFNGNSMGFVVSKDEVEEIIHQVEQETAGYLGRPYNLASDIKYKLSYMQRDNMVNKEDFKIQLLADVNELSTRYVVKLNGEIVGANTSKTALEMMKARILAERAPQDAGLKSTFVEDLEISEELVSNTYIKSIADIEETLTGKTQSVIVHDVERGDTLGSIAQKYGLSATALQSLNPGIGGGSMQVGAQVRVAAEVPKLSVKSTKQITYSESVAYDVQVEYSADMYKNESKITQKGVSGTVQVIANLVYVNGNEISREILSRTEISAPVLEVKVIGTKELPAKAASGTFMWPFRGTITSRYGYRWGSEMHTGLDIAGPSGSPVVAADGGTVTLAKWNGNFGYCVIIDHGNGMQTLYAHNSKLLVTRGQKVAKGERISLVGSTGRSTGPHCHFEVQIGGRTVNPMSYLK